MAACRCWATSVWGAISGKTSLDTIAVDLAKEAASWGMSVRRAEAIVTSCMEHVRDVVDTTALPPGAERVTTNLDAMWVRRSWPAHLGSVAVAAM